MALLFCDSFDHYASAGMAYKWTYRDGANVTIDASYGRFSTGGCKITYNSSGVYKTHDQKRTLVAGVAVKVPNVTPGVITPIAFCEALYTQPQCCVCVNASKYLEVRRGDNNGTVLATSTDPLTQGWHYVEFKAYIDDSAGTTEVHLDGVEVAELTLTDQDTQNRTNNYADITRLCLSTGGSQADYYFDDFYLCDTTGSYCNDFLGDIRVECKLPDGAGDSVNTDWTPSAGDNYECVNESPPTDDTDYVSSETADNIDTYAFAALATTAGSVKAVTVWNYARKDDAGTRQIAAVARHDTSESYGSTVTLSATYTHYGEIYHVNPSTTSAWTIAEVNEAEFGVKLIA